MSNTAEPWPPEGSTGPSSRRVPPRVVTFAFRLGLVATAIRLVLVVIFPLVMPSATDAKFSDDPGSVLGRVLGELLFLAIGVFLIFRMREGQNAARIIVAIFAIFMIPGAIGGTMGVLGALGGELDTKSLVGFPLAMLQGAAFLALVVMMFVPSANAYFRKGGPGQSRSDRSSTRR